MSGDDHQRASRNVRLYPWYAAAQSAYFWMPIFFLYFNQKVALREVLWLEAIYYASVVLLEVPSGYASDTLGRRPTLLASSLALVLSYALFVVGDGFLALAAAQALLAAGIALGSGTDTSFHLDSLTACGREEEFGAREARVSRWVFWSTAGAAVVGGAAASLGDLRVAYGLAGVAAAAALGVGWWFVEPAPSDSGAEPGGFGRQLSECLSHARTPPLRWLLAAAVAMTVSNHIPYEFYQPYLDLLAQQRATEWTTTQTPLLAGCHMGVAFGLAGWIGGHSVALAQRLGTRRLLTLSLAGQLALTGAMGLWLSPWVAALLMLRSVPGALQRAPLNREVAPRVPSRLRATYLSIQSLAGRLGFMVTLLLLSLLASQGAAATWDELSALTRVVVGCAAVVWIGLSVWREPLTDA